MKNTYKVIVTEKTSGNHFSEEFTSMKRAEEYANFVNESNILEAEIVT